MRRPTLSRDVKPSSRRHHRLAPLCCSTLQAFPSYPKVFDIVITDKRGVAVAYVWPIDKDVGWVLATSIERSSVLSGSPVQNPANPWDTGTC
jgi:hypothetical protein